MHSWEYLKQFYCVKCVKVSEKKIDLFRKIGQKVKISPLEKLVLTIFGWSFLWATILGKKKLGSNPPSKRDFDDFLFQVGLDPLGGPFWIFLSTSNESLILSLSKQSITHPVISVHCGHNFAQKSHFFQKIAIFSKL